jgi:hypothetical protein
MTASIDLFIQRLASRGNPLTEVQFYERLYKFSTGNAGRYIPNAKVGNNTAVGWWNAYNDLLDLHASRRNRGRRVLDERDEIAYPFKSKVKRYLRANPDTKVEILPTDSRPKIKAYQKPTFSKYHGTWEIDLVFNLLSPRDQLIHLFAINVNTKYLVVFPIGSKETPSIGAGLNYLIANWDVRCLKGDAEKGFIRLMPQLDSMGVATDFKPSIFTNHTRIVDTVIRTIRNAIGYRNITEEQLQQIVDYYNNTHHTTIDCNPYY